jgi:hypothetical protein
MIVFTTVFTALKTNNSSSNDSKTVIDISSGRFVFQRESYRDGYFTRYDKSLKHLIKTDDENNTSSKISLVEHNKKPRELFWFNSFYISNSGKLKKNE